MWKDQFRTTTMNIIRWPEIRKRNRGVLDMPARPSPAPRTIPEYLARLLAFPQGKVAGMLFPWIWIDSVNGEVLKLLVRELPVARKLGNIKVDIIFNPVRQSLLEKPWHLIDYLRNMIR